MENRPLIAYDPNGEVINFIAAGIGAAAGLLIGGGIETGRQLWKEGKVSSWKSIGASAAGGAISGGVAGLTLGGSLLVEGGVAGVSTVAGAATTRALLGEKQSLRASAQDFAIGVVTLGIAKGGSALVRSVTNKISRTVGSL